MMFGIPEPYTIAAKGAIALCLLIAAFGFGYYEATGQYEAALLNQQQAIAQAVKDKLSAQHDAAVKEGQLVEARRRQGDAAVKAVMDAIEKLPNPVTQACEITPEALHLLNEAGRK